MKFTNKSLGDFEIQTKEDLGELISQLVNKDVDDYRFADDERDECPEGYNYLFQLKFKDEDGYWTVGYSDINSIHI